MEDSPVTCSIQSSAGSVEEKEHMICKAFRMHTELPIVLHRAHRGTTPAPIFTHMDQKRGGRCRPGGMPAVSRYLLLGRNLFQD